jgi:endonuclease YncB( thermonuclease family)
MPRLIHPRVLAPACAALILALLACETSGLPIPQQTSEPLEPSGTYHSPGTSLPGMTIPPVDGPNGTGEPGITAAPTLTSPPGDLALVTRIVDGDTIKAALNGEQVTIRYIGINTPEVEEPCYAEATAANKGLVSGQTVTLVTDVSDTDQYGRLLRYVYANGVFVNAELVRQGWAEAYRYPPDTGHAEEFHDLALEARGANLGCWPTGVFGPPAPGQPTAESTSTVLPGTATSTARPPATKQPSVGVCDCDHNKYNCSSFASRADAQACFDYCVGQGAGDVHLLDSNSNGLACENIP